MTHTNLMIMIQRKVQKQRIIKITLQILILAEKTQLVVTARYVVNNYNNVKIRNLIFKSKTIIV